MLKKLTLPTHESLYAIVATNKNGTSYQNNQRTMLWLQRIESYYKILLQWKPLKIDCSCKDTCIICQIRANELECSIKCT